MGNSSFSQVICRRTGSPLSISCVNIEKGKNVLMTLEAMVGKKASFGIFKLRKQICLQNDIYHIEQSEGI